MTTISALSTEYLRYQVTATVAGTARNPTSDSVQFAFTNGGANPVTYYAGSWETVNGSYFALCLIGPAAGVITLTPGTWTVWMKITDSPEVPVRNVGTITVV